MNRIRKEKERRRREKALRKRLKPNRDSKPPNKSEMIDFSLICGMWWGERMGLFTRGITDPGHPCYRFIIRIAIWTGAATTGGN